MAKSASFQASYSSTPSRTFLWIAGLTTVAALFVHGYLYSQHIDLKVGTATGKSLCDINELFSCSAVTASRFAQFLGVPMALWGFAANAVLLLFLMMTVFTEDEKKAAHRRNILIVSGTVVIASIVMGSISLFLLEKYCPFCIAAYLLSFVTFFALWKAFPKTQKIFSSNAVKFEDFTPLIVLGAIAFVGSFIASAQIEKSYNIDKVDQAAAQYIAEWKVNPVQQLNLADPLVVGPAADKARMTVVEFADFRCIHCKHAAPVLKSFVSAHSDVRFEFQPWPLDGECNSKIPSANGASCLLARAVWCAEKKAAGGWAAHDYIYEQEIYPTLDAVTAALPQIAAAAKMDEAVMRECVASPEAKDLVRKQADVGSALNIQGTPTIYANGKLLPGGQILPVLNEAHASLR